MPTVCDTPDLRAESAVVSLAAAPSYAQSIPTGLWQRLTQAVGRLHAGRPHRLTYDGGVPRVPLETYPERLAREKPYLYIDAYALCG
jgi:hypothetical protein